VLCVSVAFGVLHASSAQQPESLAAIIRMLGTPGSESNPLRPAFPTYVHSTNDIRVPWSTGISIPRLNEDDAERAVGTLEDMPQEDVIYTIRTVVSRDGRISNFEVLLSNGEPLERGKKDDAAGHARAVFDAVQQSRFSPAHTPLGQAVAVDMVWVIAKTTAVVGTTGGFAAPAVGKPRQKDAPKPVSNEPDPVDPLDPTNRRSGTIASLPTA
jgi:hypothetical protein